MFRNNKNISRRPLGIKSKVVMLSKFKCVPSDFVCVDYEEKKKYPRLSLEWMNEFHTFVEILFTKTN